MKTLSITFSLTLEVACPDHLDTGWVASEFLSRSHRFSILHIDGDPGAVVVTAAYSALEGSRITRQVSAPPEPTKATSINSLQSPRLAWRAKHPMGRLFNLLDKIL
jgi:uncharacterized iron-regulated membrane protein